MIYDEKNDDKVNFVKIDKINKVTTYDVEFIDDFKLQVFDIDEKRIINIERNSIILCLEGNVKINGILCESLNSLFVEDEIKGANVELCDGYSSAQIYKVYKK